MPATRAITVMEPCIERGDVAWAGANLAESLRLFEPLFGDAPFGLGFVDRDFRVVRMNQRLAEVNGSAIARQLGRRVSAIVPELWPTLEPLYRRVLDSGKAVLHVEADGCATTDGSTRCRWSTSYYPVVVDGNVIGIGVVAVDITQRTEAERAMQFQADLLAAVGQAVVATDPAGTVVYWNPAAEGMYGWSAEEAIGRDVGELISTGETVKRGEAIVEDLLRGESWSGDYWVRHRDGTVFPVYVTDSPVLGRDGQLSAIIAVSVDVTERRSAEELGRQLSAIVDGSGDAIFGVTNDGVVTSWNAAAQRLFGYAADEIVGHSIAMLTPSHQAATQADVRARVTAGGKAERFETTRCRQDGSEVEVLMTVSPVTDDAQGVSGLSVIVHDITERRRAQRRQDATLRQLAEAQRVARFGSAEFDLVTGDVTRSEEYYRILGVDPLLNPRTEDLIGMLHPDDRDTVLQGWAEIVERGTAFDTVCRIIRPDGDQRWIRLRAVAQLDGDGTPVALTATLLDESERIEAERVQRSAESRFEVGFEHAGIGAAIANLDGIPTRVNAAVVALLGRSEDQLVGRRWTEYAPPDEVSLGEMAMARVAAGHDTYEAERRYLRPDGTLVWASAHIRLVRDESGEPDYFFAQLQDITERKTAEQALVHEALHDPLTGLPNRALLTDRLQHRLSGGRPPGARLAVMFVNIDYFKQINESMGHAAGDLVLRHVADRIAGAIRPGDTVARFGGDEFVVVCDNVSVLEAEQIAHRVLNAVHQPCLIADCGTIVNASIGVALADENATPESMLRECGAAMYRAKERGRARVELFDETLRAKAERRFSTVAALQQALERDEFTVHYQPVVDLATGAMVSAEALVRWEHPVRGLVPPGEFIPLAEETGLIVPLGNWILEQACQQVVEWQRTNPSMTVAVNLSVRQLLTPGMASVVEDVLRRTDAAPHSLCLELIESAFMEDVDYFATTLAGVKALGVQLSIDDFGTGYSALSYLKQFPVDAVKIDRTFVDGLGSDNHDTAIVAAILAMAAALDLEVTAEGVETRDQLAHLRTLNCQRAQGYYLARPMPAAAISQLVADRHHWQVD